MKDYTIHDDKGFNSRPCEGATQQPLQNFVPQKFQFTPL